MLLVGVKPNSDVLSALGATIMKDKTSHGVWNRAGNAHIGSRAQFHLTVDVGKTLVNL